MTPKQARELCIEAHKGQFRRPVSMDWDDVTKLLGRNPLNKEELTFKDGSKLEWFDLVEQWEYSMPYSSHPTAVAEMMTTDEEKIVAYLHDVIEDTDWTYTKLYDLGLSELPDAYRNALKLLTKEPGQDYDLYIFNISCCRIARKVKIADITCNLLDNPSDKQREKYRKAIRQLLQSL